MKFKFRNVSGMPFSPRGTTRMICTLLIFFIAIERINMNALYVWVSYLFIDNIGEWIAKDNWRKQIGENPLNGKRLV